MIILDHLQTHNENIGNESLNIMKKHQIFQKRNAKTTKTWLKHNAHYQKSTKNIVNNQNQVQNKL